MCGMVTTKKHAETSPTNTCLLILERSGFNSLDEFERAAMLYERITGTNTED